MDFKHRNHLLSTYVNLRKQVEDIRGVICEGHTPTGMSSPLTPLPPVERTRMLETLQQLVSQCEELMRRYVPEAFERWHEPQPVSATKMWVSVLLRQVRDQLHELHPERFERRFGKLVPSERDILAEEIQAMLDLLEQLESEEKA